MQPPAGGLRDSTARSEIVATKTSRGWGNDETLAPWSVPNQRQFAPLTDSPGYVE